MDQPPLFNFESRKRPMRVPDGPQFTRDLPEPKAHPALAVYWLACAAEKLLGDPFVPVWGADSKSIRGPLAQLGYAELERRWLDFLRFSQRDTFAGRNRRIRYFVGQINNSWDESRKEWVP